MLNEKKARFALEYLIDLNATEAAKRAGYSERTAYSIGQRLLQEGEVQGEIDRLKAERAERTQTDADYVLRKLRLIADSSIEQYVTLKDGCMVFKDFDQLTSEQLNAIESIENNKFGLKLKLHGKSWTLDMIAKHIGFYEKDNKQKNPDDGIDYSKLSREAMAEILNATKDQ